MLGDASLDIITTRNFSARLLEDVLWVASIPQGDIKRYAWPLIRAMLFRHDESEGGDEERAPYEDEDSGFFSLTHDEDGLSLVMDDICKSAFDEFSDSVRIIYAPCRWRAFQIHLGTSAMPGVVCLLSSILAEASISILNVSTYDADFILVQEADVVKATGMIRDSLKRGLHGLFEQQQSLTLATAATAPGQASLRANDEAGSELSELETVAGDARTGTAGFGGDARPGSAGFAHHAPDAADEEGDEAPGKPLSEGAVLAVQRQSAIVANARNLYLKVLAPTLTVTRLHERSVSGVATCLIKLLLFRESGPAHFWAYSCVTDGAGGAGDISLIMDEGAAALFPPEAVVGNCGTWRAVKLCGHKFAFDETGVVSAMLHGVCTQVWPLRINTPKK